MGGNRVDFIRHYAETSIRMVMDPAHAAAWREVRHKDGYNMLMEQYALAACIDFHRFHPDSLYRGVAMRYVFQSMEEAFSPQSAAQAGFTHLLGDSKAHPEVASRIERRMAMIDPGFYRQCERVAQRASGARV
jgi:hypothetical protein